MWLWHRLIPTFEGQWTEPQGLGDLEECRVQVQARVQAEAEAVGEGLLQVNSVQKNHIPEGSLQLLVSQRETQTRGV